MNTISKESKSLLKEGLNGCGFCHPIKPLVLYETDNFFVILSIGQITEGYLLICSKTHRSCCGDIPREQIKELKDLKALVQSILMQTYKVKPIFYEHGKNGSCMRDLISNRGDLCHHAHLHCLPLELDLFDLIYALASSYEELKDFYDLHKIRNQDLQGGSYLLYENTKNQKFIFYTDQISVPSQFLRKCVAKKIGKNYLALWRRYPGWDKIDKAHKVLKPLFKAYENKKI